jgi:hypothetical protein
MQPYFDPTRKITPKKWKMTYKNKKMEDDLKKGGDDFKKKWKMTSKKWKKMEDDLNNLIFFNGRRTNQPKST